VSDIFKIAKEAELCKRLEGGTSEDTTDDTNKKLVLALVSIAKIGEKTLLPPDYMKSPTEAKAYMLGSAAAFKQIADMALFVLGEVE
jgi:hypothetical protein